MITQGICKLPTSAAIELSGRAAGLLARIEACRTTDFEGGTNGAKALGLSDNKKHLKKYRDELVKKGFGRFSGKSESRCYRLKCSRNSRRFLRRSLTIFRLEQIQD